MAYPIKVHICNTLVERVFLGITWNKTIGDSEQQNQLRLSSMDSVMALTQYLRCLRITSGRMK